MAIEIPGFVYSRKAAQDMSGTAFQFRAMKIGTTANTFDRASTDEEVIGILTSRPRNFRAGALMAEGIAKVVAGGVVSAGAEVGSDSLGRAYSIGSAVKSFGRAMDTATTAGQVIPVLLALQATRQD